jgi:hypothetical protein
VTAAIIVALDLRAYADGAGVQGVVACARARASRPTNSSSIVREAAMMMLVCGLGLAWTAQIEI